MSASLTPWMGVVVGGAANTPQSLQSLLLAATNPPRAGLGNVLKACYISIQADPSGGGTKYYIGPSTMSTTDYGVQLVALGIWNPPSSSMNLYRLDQIYLESDGSEARWYVSFITK